MVENAYRSRMLGLLGQMDPLSSLSTSVPRATAVFERLREKGMERSYAPGKWTAREIFCHLADAEIGTGFRIRQALAEERHRVQAFDQDAWATRYRKAEAGLAMAAFKALREWNLALFRSLTPEDRSRVVVHPERGEESVDVMIRMLAGHDLNHLAQLEQIAET
jgi:DinB superfamily